MKTPSDKLSEKGRITFLTILAEIAAEDQGRTLQSLRITEKGSGKKSVTVRRESDGSYSESTA